MRCRITRCGTDGSDMSADQAARRMWTLFEPVHAVTYFAAEARAAFEAAGLRGFWRGYFAGRAAPLGPVSAAPVTASFFTFAPATVSRAIPGVWDLITPDEALRVRQAGAVAALRRLLDGLGDAVPAAADLLATAAAGLDCSGRVLASANAALPVPDDPGRAAVARRDAAPRASGRGALRGAGGRGYRRLRVERAAGGSRPAAGDHAAAARLDRRAMGRRRRQAGRTWPARRGRQRDRRKAWRCARRSSGPPTSRPHGRGAIRNSPPSLAEVLRPIALACSAELPALNPVGVPGPERAALGEQVDERAAPRPGRSGQPGRSGRDRRSLPAARVVPRGLAVHRARRRPRGLRPVRALLAHPARPAGQQRAGAVAARAAGAAGSRRGSGPGRSCRSIRRITPGSGGWSPRRSRRGWWRRSRRGSRRSPRAAGGGGQRRLVSSSSSASSPTRCRCGSSPSCSACRRRIIPGSPAGRPGWRTRCSRASARSIRPSWPRPSRPGWSSATTSPS